ncbi:MAG: Phenylalanine--tRNA ligase alpha subunit [Alphaproteobacteria bacterium MarineAlpha5_Bin8]|mgnify:CR=1 FL=1|nr:MAG: Phenylalanine--tRNA ligase alpha subunit [Alphaproteobacteria bacterium MarineAlpha5_Bin7]PPR48266.1 MAG: Phenylalanine--tRNA ligase alpha subunit [Alphaproteobacteria bacterium MarineAlpha5_Bin8]PPR55005.1 MAG: Phenylalanine--tRNA ligase alpha subunit [Alphaproteobacteria bacterium MarineAlpha5_Bin6]|tara:strand:+ start:364 stop:1428 length:1065 start_codon:yes stop_codon:yes gene_type:complete
MSSGLDKNDIANKISKINKLTELESFRVQYVGKKGILTSEMKSLSTLSNAEKKEKGQYLNSIKIFLETELKKKKNFIENLEVNEKLKKEKIDITLPPRNYETGKIHPISQTIYNVIDIFGSMGFSVESGPDIESDFNNFTALNIPSHHPAREMQDTFYVENSSGDEEKVLRTHTSPVQVRHMLNSKPPIRIIVPGRTYRSDSDATHTPMFHQVEGLLIDNNSNMAHLKGCLIDFLKEFFNIDDLQYRFRPSYFPFTEPSAEMDVAYTKKDGVLKIGKGNEWLEILGCGMVNPRVLENCNIDSQKFQGFAFGMGIERLSMLKFGITDMRGFFDSDFRWLNHYGFNPLDSTSSSGI